MTVNAASSPNEGILEQLSAIGVVPVVRTASADDARFAVEALKAGGLGVFELTMTTPDALSVARELSADADCLIGMGTVLDADSAERAIDAGARFCVSPAVCEPVARVCRDRDVPCLLGALTPSEVLQAVAAGASAVKIFPASAMGGAGFLRALRDVFPAVPLVPTGGVSIDGIGDYLAAGAAFVGVGGKLVARDAIAARDAAALGAAARQALANVAAARQGGD